MCDFNRRGGVMDQARLLGVELPLVDLAPAAGRLARLVRADGLVVDAEHLQELFEARPCERCGTARLV